LQIKKLLCNAEVRCSVSGKGAAETVPGMEEKRGTVLGSKVRWMVARALAAADGGRASG